MTHTRFFQVLYSWVTIFGLLPGVGSSTSVMPPPPDPDAAIRSEFKMIEKKGTKEDYERFIRRHPLHPLARIAKQRAEQL